MSWYQPFVDKLRSLQCAHLRTVMLYAETQSTAVYSTTGLKWTPLDVCWCHLIIDKVLIRLIKALFFHCFVQDYASTELSMDPKGYNPDSQSRGNGKFSVKLKYKKNYCSGEIVIIVAIRHCLALQPPQASYSGHTVQQKSVISLQRVCTYITKVTPLLHCSVTVYFHKDHR